MRDFLGAARLILIDMAAALLLLLVLQVSDSLPLAVACGMLLGVAQIAWEIRHARAVDTLQWVSLVVVISSGAATLLAQDLRFILFKPSLVYLVIGIAMLKRGWMTRYLPPRARERVPDLGIAFGYVWAGLMFLTAAVNLAAAMLLEPARWAAFMALFALGSKLGLFVPQYLVMRWVARRRVRATGSIACAEQPLTARVQQR